MVHFVKKLRQLKPDLIVGQPAYGYPAVPAESEVINASWNIDSTTNNVADSVGLRVYEGTGNVFETELASHFDRQHGGFKYYDGRQQSHWNLMLSKKR